jgi:hypothetical protein
MGEYMKCPRCDLNWIKQDQGLCDVCKAELKMDGATLLVDELEDEDLVLCPICKQNYMNPQDEMCEQCMAEHSDKNEIRDNDGDEESWLREYIDEPTEEEGDSLSDDWDDDNTASLSQLQDDAWDEDEDEGYDDVNNMDDDFDSVDPDDFDDEDFDDDEEEDDEELDEE